MKKQILFLSVVTALLLSSIVISSNEVKPNTISYKVKLNLDNVEHVTKSKPVINSLKNWDIFVQALIWVESNGHDSILGPDIVQSTGPTNARGCLQITPIYVMEVNRLCKLKRIDNSYDFNDAFNRVKSLEMFEIMQSHYNKKRDFEKAAILHNPGAGKWYFNRVWKKYLLLISK